MTATLERVPIPPTQDRSRVRERFHAAYLHLQDLSAAGIGAARVSELTSIGLTTINNIACKQPRNWARREVLEAILAVPVDPLRLARDAAFIDGTGTRRRIQAMSVMGWPLQNQADTSGIPPTTYPRLRYAQRVHARHARAVDRLYNDRRYRRGASTKAGRFARRREWVGPDAWTDETIDDPHAHPYVHTLPSAEPGQR